MRPARLAVAASVGALVLLAVDLAWIAFTFPDAVPRWIEAWALFITLTPAAIGCGIVLAIAEGLVWLAVVQTDSWLLRRGLMRRSHAAALTAAASIPPSLVLAATILSNPRARLFPRAALVVSIVALAAGSVWFAVRIASQVRRTSPDRDARTARGLKASGALLAAAVGVVFVALDHTILVRLYQPMHLGLRLGALAAFQVTVLFVASTPRRRLFRNRLPRAASGAVLVGLLAIFAALPLFGASKRRPSLSGALLYGASAATFAEMHSRLRPHSRPPAIHGPTSPVTEARPNVRNRAAKGHGPKLPGASLLLVTVDALRADHLGVYGYARPTSPSLDRFAKESVVFERAYTAAPHTSFALTSLLIGRPAVALAHVGHLDGHHTLADLLNAHGYATAAFVPPAIFFVEPERFRSYERRQLGFRHLDMQALDEDQSAPVQTTQVVDYLDRHRPARFAAWVHYFAPHEPYVTHAENGVAPFGHRAVDRYDEEIRWVDREIGRLINEVRIRYPRTVIVVTADHGEEFGEHGGAYHGTTLFDEQIRVPLIINAPGFAHHRVSAPVGAVDVLPTLLALLEVSPPTDLPGVDLGPWLAATKPATASPIAVAENGTALRMIVGEGHKLICNISWPDCILFDLGKDAAERRDIIATRPEVAGRLKRDLAAWQASVAQGPAPTNVSGVQVPFDVVLARARLRDPTTAPELIALLASQALPASQRTHVARHLAFVASGRHRKAVRELAASEVQPGALLWLQTVLTVLGDRDSASKLEGSLRASAATPADDELIVRAALALASARVAPDVDLLSRALVLTDDVETRCNIFRALGRCRDRALAARLLMADYDTVRTRVCSARALAALAHPETLAFVVEKLPIEPYASVQLHLIEALRRMGDLRAVPTLAALGTATQEPQVRAAAERAVVTLRADRRSPPSVRLRARRARHRMEAG